MKKSYILGLFTLLTHFCVAQVSDTLPPLPQNPQVAIASARLQLKQAFLLNDPAGASLWMDSLSRLEDENYTGLVWDERWLLYYWTESYGTLLTEVSLLDANLRAEQMWKVQPPKDSLFQQIDFWLNEQRFEVFRSIGNAFLNQEEKAFTTLLFEYLLRLNKDEEEWAERLQSFVNLYPKSKYDAFVRSIKPTILKPANKAFSISAGLQVGNWRGDIERSLTTPYAFNVDASYWAKRWNVIVDMAFGGPRIRRDILVDGSVWPKDDPTSFFTVGLHLGYDLVNKSKIRVYPSIGGGFGVLKPPTPGEIEDPLPGFYDDFYFNEFHLSAALNADVKLFTKNYRKWETPKGSYHGVRLKFGWNGLRFGQKNDFLQGQMLYFSINYAFFAHLAKK